MTSLTRRATLGALAAPAFIRGASAAPEVTSFDLIGVRDPQLGAQLAVASEFDLFRPQGITVNIRWTQSAADTLTIMGGGSAPVGVGGSFTQVVFGAQRLPIRTISALADIAETQGFALAPGVRLGHPRELEGKRIAFTQGNSQVLLLAKLASLYGFDQSKVQLVNMNQSEGIVAASRGDVQGLMGWQPNLYRLIAMGGTMYCTGATLYVNGRSEPRPADDLLLFNHSTLMASQEWIDTKPNTLTALLKGLMAANAILLEDKPRALGALERVLRIDKPALEVMMNANKYALGISPALIASHRFQSEWAVSINRAPSPPRAEDCFTTRIAEMADPSLVTWRPAA